MRARDRAAAVLAAVAALSAVIAGSGANASASPGSAHPAPAAVLDRAEAVARPVLLPDGEQLTVTPEPGGRSAVIDRPPAGIPASLISLSTGGHAEEIPADALPYLGRGLDPSLFDLSVLQRSESLGRLPVRVTFRERRPSLPGVTITQSGPGNEAGYLTGSSARAFGAALARQFHADHARDSYGRDGLFADGVSIAVDGALAPAPRSRPDLPKHVLTVTATNLSGKPDNGDVAFAYNVDDLALISDPVFNYRTFHNGVAKFSVPAGHYVVIGDFEGPDSAGHAVTRLVVLPRVTVSQNTAVSVAERAATSEVTMATPRPAVLQDVSGTIVLRDVHRDIVGLSATNAPGSVWVSPTTRKPAAGTMQAFASAQLTSPPGTAGIPYAYNLDFKDRAGTVPAQHYHVVQSRLATVTERYYQDAPATGAWATAGAFLAEDEAAGGAEGGGVPAFVLGPLPLPGVQVQYFSAAADLYWDSMYFMSATQGNGGQDDLALRVLSPGQQAVVDWNRYPLHPQPDYNTGIAGGLNPVIPSATRAGDTLRLAVSPFADNQPGHVSFSPAAVVGYTVDQNGTRIARGNGLNGIPPVTLSKSPSVIRFSLDASGPAYQRWTGSQTTWTWRSVRRPRATLPPSWFCSEEFHPVDRLLRRCAVQPMMTLNYLVQGMALNGTVRAGPQLVDVHAGHIQLAPATRITGATAQVSCDDGRSWRSAAVRSAGGGNFRVAFTAPAGCAVTLRVSAADAAGGSIAQTITRAYKIAP
jgi:hypothetical protein